MVATADPRGRAFRPLRRADGSAPGNSDHLLGEVWRAARKRFSGHTGHASTGEGQAKPRPQTPCWQHMNWP